LGDLLADGAEGVFLGDGRLGSAAKAAALVKQLATTPQASLPSNLKDLFILGLLAI
jgi:hypothetical protein